MSYEHTQSSPLALVVGSIFALIAVTILIFVPSEELPNWFFAVILGLGLGLGIVFSRLTSTVSPTEVQAAFGLGWPKRVIQLGEVTGVEVVRNKWWYGLGIRLVPGGWMYNVWGLDAVRIDLRSGKSFRIGSDDAEQLRMAIAAAAGLSG